MQAYRLVIPNNNKNRNEWFSFINESILVDKSEINHLIVDFNQVSFLDTDDFVVLACVIEFFYNDGIKVVFEGGQEKFNLHLYNIKFKSYWVEGFKRDRFTVSRNNTTLCLWKISKEMIYSYSSYAKGYFEGFTDNKDLLPVASNMDEVFNNIFDHSKSSITGYIITQYYPKINKLSFSVCDFGIGIPSSINTYRNSLGKKTIPDWKALLKSLEMGYSINSSPTNRGFGLNNILELTESSNGTLSIISNNGIVQKNANLQYLVGETNFNFKGTLIKIEVDLNSFSNKEDFFDVIDF